MLDRETTAKAFFKDKDDEALKALSELGITLKNQDGTFKTIQEVFDSMSDKWNEN